VFTVSVWVSCLGCWGIVLQEALFLCFIIYFTSFVCYLLVIVLATSCLSLEGSGIFVIAVCININIYTYILVSYIFRGDIDAK